MTPRERAAVVLVLLGSVTVIVTAGAYGGWRLALGVAGGLMLGGGVLLGLGEGPATPGDAPMIDGDTTERLS